MVEVRRTVGRFNAAQKPLSNETPGVRHSGIVN